MLEVQTWIAYFDFVRETKTLNLVLRVVSRNEVDMCY